MAYKGNQHLPGLHPVNNQAGTSPRVKEFVVSATYAATIGEGCILQKGILGVILAAAAGTLTALNGRAMGVAAQNLGATPGADAKILVYCDPDQEYVAVQDGTMTGTAATEAVGQFVGCVSNTYNATLGQGKTLLDTSDLTSVRTTDVYLTVVGVAQAVGETLASTYSQLTVKLAQGTHAFGSHAITRVT